MNITNTRWGIFSDPALEKRFRAYSQRQDRDMATVGIVLLTLPVLLFSYSDFLLFGATRAFFMLAALRIGFLVVSCIVLLSIFRYRGVQYLDGLALAWTVLLCVVVFTITLTRPSSYAHHSLIDILILIFLYFISPLPAPRLYLGPILFTVGSLGILYFFRDPLSGMHRNVVWISFILGNVLGMSATYRIQRFQRQHFLGLLQEQKLRTELEIALENVKRLEGMLPICAHCRKVRDDDGHWETFEVYIREHTDAEFTHGYCPDCMKEHYPDALAGEGEEI